MVDAARGGELSLFAVYLGGDPAPGRLGEDHEVVFVVAGGVKEARAAARAKWAAPSRPHVDGVMRIDRVDGHRIDLVPTDAPDALALDTTYSDGDD